MDGWLSGTSSYPSLTFTCLGFEILLSSDFSSLSPPPYYTGDEWNYLL